MLLFSLCLHKETLFQPDVFLSGCRECKYIHYSIKKIELLNGHSICCWYRTTVIFNFFLAAFILFAETLFLILWMFLFDYILNKQIFYPTSYINFYSFCASVKFYFISKKLQTPHMDLDLR